MKCEKCGAPIKPTDEVCGFCGEPVKVQLENKDTQAVPNSVSADMPAKQSGAPEEPVKMDEKLSTSVAESKAAKQKTDAKPAEKKVDKQPVEGLASDGNKAAEPQQLNSTSQSDIHSQNAATPNQVPVQGGQVPPQGHVPPQPAGQAPRQPQNVATPNQVPVQGGQVPPQGYVPPQPAGQAPRQPQNVTTPNQVPVQGGQVPPQGYVPPQPAGQAPYQPQNVGAPGQIPPQSVPAYGVPQQQFSGKAPKKPKKKKSKAFKIILIVIIVLVVLGASYGGFYYYQNNKYEQAIITMDAGDYSKAATEFSSLGGFKEAEKYGKQCQDYVDAKASMDNKDYAKASEQFGALGEFGDAVSLKETCDKHVSYDEAVALMGEEKYTEAAEKFKKLGTFEDSAAKAKECANIIDYAKAKKDYDAGLYYTAYKAFDALGTYSDSATLKDSCIKDFPENSEIYHNEAYRGSVPLEIKPPSFSLYKHFYISIYAENGDLVSTLALNASGSVNVSLPVGNYKITVLYGMSDWYGEKEGFGDLGRVSTIEDEGSEIITFDGNTIYTLTLAVFPISFGSSGSTSNTTDV